MRAAVKAGVDGIEFDVWYTADRKMIVIHDDDLRRTTNGGNARVPEQTLAELRQLDAGSWGRWAAGRFAGAKLPLPAEMVREAIRGGAFPVLHIKEAELVPDVMRMLAEEKAVGRAVIFCFEYPAMQKLAKDYPQVRKAWLVDKSNFEKDGIAGVVTKAVRASAISWPPRPDKSRPRWSPPATRPNCRCGRGPWTTPARMEQLLRMGVDGIVTNDPQLLNATLARMNGHP